MLNELLFITCQQEYINLNVPHMMELSIMFANVEHHVFYQLLVSHVISWLIRHNLDIENLNSMSSTKKRFHGVLWRKRVNEHLWEFVDWKELLESSKMSDGVKWNELLNNVENQPCLGKNVSTVLMKKSLTSEFLRLFQ